MKQVLIVYSTTHMIVRIHHLLRGLVGNEKLSMNDEPGSVLKRRRNFMLPASGIPMTNIMLILHQITANLDDTKDTKI
jgi:hypothetical protein